MGSLVLSILDLLVTIAFVWYIVSVNRVMNTLLVEIRILRVDVAHIAYAIDNSPTLTDIWDKKLAGTISQLTSEDTLAQSLSLMSEEQLDRLAEKTAKLRDANERVD